MSTAYLLVSHGSPDPRPRIAVERLAYLVRQQLPARAGSPSSGARAEKPGGTATLLSPSPLPLVATACLECTPIPLHRQIQQFARQVRGAGGRQLQVVPLFLSPGVHVREDIPREVGLAQQAWDKVVNLEICPYLGSYSRILPLLARQFAQFPPGGRILLGHGSRCPGGNLPIEALACQLAAVPAYWSVAPSLAEQVAALAREGQQTIAIVPYFLFYGGIAEAIARQVQQLQAAFPALNLLLGEPLGATPELARVIVEGINP